MQWKLSLALAVFASMGCASVPKPRPAPIAAAASTPPPAPRVLSREEITELCKPHGAHCVIDYMDGRLALIGHFSNTDNLATQVENVMRDAGVPFCRQSNQSGLAARAYAHLIYSGSMYIDCQTGKKSEWVKDKPPGPIPPDVRTIAQICAYVEKDTMRPFHCELVNANGMVTLKLTSVVPASDAVPYLDDIETNLGKPFCDAGLRLNMGALIDVQFPKNGTGFRYNCEMGMSRKTYKLAQPRPSTAPAAQQPPSGTTVL